MPAPLDPWPHLDRPLLLGHRGARRAAPENSIPAFDLALAHGCDGFEFDLRRTRDGRALLCHDPKLAGVDIASETYDRILECFRAASPPRGKSFWLPPLACLEGVLARFAARAFLNIELKVAGLEDAVASALEENPPQRGHVVSSFLPDVLLAVRSRLLGSPIGFICDRKQTLALWHTLPAHVLIPHRRLVTRDLVEEVHAAGRKIFVWTVNQEKEMLRLAHWGVDAIISDDTELLGRAFANRQ